MIDWIAAALLLAGGFFCLVAGIGVVRLGDVYCRMHAATKAGTLGLALICLAATLRADGWGQMIEPLIVFVFMIATAPIGAHLIGRAAFRAGAPTKPGTGSDPGVDRFRQSADET
ncbi:monovalent cation/H(+) antiporter subunit G [Amaricoccus sp.]|uniref:monovalent cation/H(+) antiporter subunit G n=1 Tax=Amaricoccus sp. TaxID=1872485 RepID=UPI002634268F|nr:monovalent cation/H(+) antiporter subunit G [uncultured Amaricoccus sp.]